MLITTVVPLFFDPPRTRVAILSLGWHSPELWRYLFATIYVYMRILLKLLHAGSGSALCSLVPDVCVPGEVPVIRLTRAPVVFHAFSGQVQARVVPR